MFRLTRPNFSMFRPTRPKEICVQLFSIEANYVLTDSAKRKSVRLCLTKISYFSTDSTQSGYVSTHSTDLKPTAIFQLARPQ